MRVQAIQQQILGFYIFHRQKRCIFWRWQQSYADYLFPKDFLDENVVVAAEVQEEENVAVIQERRIQGGRCRHSEIGIEVVALVLITEMLIQLLEVGKELVWLVRLAIVAVIVLIVSVVVSKLM